jgi:hypothetical protein
MPKAASAGTGTPVSGNHDNAMELSAPVEEEDTTPSSDDTDELGSHRDDEEETADDGSEEESSEVEVPVRLKGKPLPQIYKEFSGLEKDRSRLANELGEARALLRQALEMTLKQQPAAADNEEDADPTDEEWEENPREAVRKAVAKATKPLETKLATAEQRAAILEFDQRHPGYQEEAATPEFQEWVRSSPFRTRLFKAAAAFDLEAAEDLFAAWEERKAAKPAAGEDEETPAEKKREQIRRQKTETGGAGKTAGGKSGKKIYKSSELMRLYTQDRERYNAMAEEIRLAFAEGRVR